MRSGKIIALSAIAAAGAAATAALASDTASYGYDARGRLVKVVRTGTVNNGITTSYSHDKANNRRNKTTTGAPN